MLRYLAFTFLILATFGESSPIPAPAPPSTLRAKSGSSHPPPITEAELHEMIEQLLMEVYGDEYEPPPGSGKQQVPSAKDPASLQGVELVNLPQGQSVTLPDSEEAQLLMIEGLLQNLFPAQEPPPPSSVNNINPGVDFPTGSSSPLLTARPMNTFSPQEQEDIQESLRNEPDTSLPHDSPTDPQTDSTTPDDSVLSPGEIQNALVFEQAGQPKILIVDRRTKKEPKNLEEGRASSGSKSGRSIDTTASSFKTEELNSVRVGRASDSSTTLQLAPTNINLNSLYQQPSSVQASRLLSMLLSNDARTLSVAQPKKTQTVHSQTSRAGSASVGVPLPSISRSDNVDNLNSFTVGDLVRSLDGRNGIKVLSVKDMNKLTTASSKQNPVDVDGSMLQKLRNALISENIEVDLPREQRQLDGLFDSGVGVPLPSLSSNLGDGNLNSFDIPANSDDLLTGSFSLGNGGSTVNDIINTPRSSSSDIGVPLPDLGSTDTTDSIDVGAELGDYTDLLSANYDDYGDYDFSSDGDDDGGFSIPSQPPNVFRTGVSDILFTKGQWIGTLIGGLIDIGSAIGESVSKLTSSVGSSSKNNN